MTSVAKIRPEKEAKSPSEENKKRKESCERELNLTELFKHTPGPDPDPEPEPDRIPDTLIAKGIQSLRCSTRGWIIGILTDISANGRIDGIERIFEPFDIYGWDGPTTTGNRLRVAENLLSEAPGPRELENSKIIDFRKRFDYFLLSCVVWGLLEELIFADTYPVGFTAEQKAEIDNVDKDCLLSGEDKRKNRAEKLIEYISHPFSKETEDSLLAIYTNMRKHILIRLLNQDIFAKHENDFRTHIFLPAITIHAWMRCSLSQYHVSPPLALARFSYTSVSEIKSWSIELRQYDMAEVERWTTENTSGVLNCLHLELEDFGILFELYEYSNDKVSEHNDTNVSGSANEDGSGSSGEDGSGSSGEDGSGSSDEDSSESCEDECSESCDDGFFEPSNSGASEYNNKTAYKSTDDEVCEFRNGASKIRSTGKSRPIRKKLQLIKTRDGVIRYEPRETKQVRRKPTAGGP